MISKEKRSEDFDSSGLIVFLYKWRKPLFIILAASLVLSWFFSGPWFISPKFKATVVLFPTSSNSISNSLFGEQGGNRSDLMAFGEDEQAEQLLQILSSNKIRDRIIRKFNLMQHYDIDTNSKYKNSNLFKEYEKNISFRRTEFMAVQITVYDTDPQLAADIANSIAELIDSTKNEMQRQRAIKGFHIVEAEYKKLQEDINATVDSLVKLGDLGIYDVEYQSQVLNQQMAITIMNGNKTAQAALQKKLDILGKYGGIYLSLKNALEFKTEQLTLLQTKYKEAKVNAEEDLPQKFIVSDAYKPERKSYPVRWLVMLVTTFSVFFLALMVLIIMEKISAYNSHKTFNLG
jgi:capsular polysaccharide biosynthesis protein